MPPEFTVNIRHRIYAEGVPPDWASFHVVVEDDCRATGFYVKTLDEISACHIEAVAYTMAAAHSVLERRAEYAVAIAPKIREAVDDAA